MMLDLKQKFHGYWMKGISSWCFCIVMVFVSMVSAVAGVPVEQWKTTNGAKVMFVGTSAVPIVDISVEFDAGSRFDPANKSGLAALTNSMLDKGIASRYGVKGMSESQIMDAFADAGAIQFSKIGMDRSGYRLRVLSDQTSAHDAIQLMGRFLAYPSFPEEVLKRERAIMTAVIKEELTRPQNIGSRTFQQILYGEHPYGRSPTEASIAAITRKDIINFYRTYYVADRAVIGIVGNVTRKQAEDIAERMSQQLSVSSFPIPTLPDVPEQKDRIQMIPHPASQAHLFKGMAAIKRGDPDFFALTVGNYILGGGGFSSRLMNEVREKQGLSYGVSSNFQSLLQPGPFTISLQTKKSQVSEALKVVNQTLNDFLKNGPTAQEVQEAKAHLMSGFVMNLDGNQKILDLITMIGAYDLPLDYLDTWTDKIQSVTVDDVRAAFNRKLSAEKMTTVVVGN